MAREMRAGVVVAALLVLVGACASPGPTGTPLATTPVPATPPATTSQPSPTLQPTPTASSTATVEPTVGPSTVPPTETPPLPTEGPPPAVGDQTITSDDGTLELFIPAGALDEPVDITVTDLHDLVTATRNTFGYALEPEGLAFNREVRVIRKMPAVAPTDGASTIPVVTLSRLSATGDWDALTHPAISHDLTTGEWLTAGWTSQLGNVYGVSNHWVHTAHTNQPNFVAAIGQDFFVSGEVYSDLDGQPLDLDQVEAVEPDEATDAGETLFFGTSFQQIYRCVAPGPGKVTVMFRVLDVPNNPDDLTGATVGFNMTGEFDCLANSPTPPLESACLSMINEPLGDYPRRIVGDFAFDEGVQQRDIERFLFGMPDANRGEPVEAEHVFATTWQAVLGFEARRDNIGPWGITVANVETPDRVVHNIRPAVIEALGTIPHDFGPGDSVGDLCGGFGEPF